MIVYWKITIKTRYETYIAQNKPPANSDLFPFQAIAQLLSRAEVGNREDS